MIRIDLRSQLLPYSQENAPTCDEGTFLNLFLYSDVYACQSGNYIPIWPRHGGPDW